MIIQSYKGEYRADLYSDFSFFDELNKLDNRFFVVDRKVYGIYKEELKNLIGDEQCFFHSW